VKQKDTIGGVDKYKYWAGLRAKSAKKKPLKKTAIKKKAYKIKKASKKLASNQRIYEVLRRDYLMDHEECECGRPECKKGPSVEIHHAAGKIGALLTEVSNFRAVSRECHDWAEAHPKEAKLIGLSVSRLNKK
jgi:hypothetical protein